MKNMASAKSFIQAPPNGRYWFNITAAEAGFTQAKGERGGDAQIKLTLEIAEGEHAGYTAYDNIGTDGGTKYGAASKKRLQQLGVEGTNSDAEIPDEVIAQQLLGRRVLVEVEREQQMSKDESGKLSPRFELDDATQQKVAVYRLKVLGYLRNPTAGSQVAHQGHVQQLPTAPAGMPAAPQFAAPGIAGFPAAPGLPGGYPAATGMAAPQMPTGYAPPGFPAVAAPAGWVPPNGAGLPVAGVLPGAPGLPGIPGQPR